MNTFIQFSVPLLGACLFALLLIPVLRILAPKIGLLDKPNARKVHSESVPLVGGITIAISTALALLLGTTFFDNAGENKAWLTGAFVMLVVGALDDRFNIKPVYRLLIQLLCAYAVAYSGIRISSFFGLFGIEQVPIVVLYTHYCGNNRCS